MVEIVRLTVAKESDVADINKLLPQLRSNAAEHHGTLSDLQRIVADPSVLLLVVRDGEKIVGMGSLYTILKVGKRSGTIEDVVVDDEYRGEGLGEKLMQELLRCAREEKLQQLYLTTRPDRVAAHQLYEKLGFEQQETDVYRMKM
ncbi:MAG TPA: GNAT family N-acetyltransferase [Candidatus Paceibacterota bacterium]